MSTYKIVIKDTLTKQYYCSNEPSNNNFPYWSDDIKEALQFSSYRLAQHEMKMNDLTESDKRKPVIVQYLNGSVCVGWLMKQDENNFPSIMLRISLSKHKVTRTYLDSLHSPAPLYKTVKEMIKANFPALLKTKK